MHEANNTVHCEYYRPAGPGGIRLASCCTSSAAIFHCRARFAYALAHRGVAALFVIMPYYGPRHDPNSSVRMISSDPRQTVDGMIQAVKDIRVAHDMAGCAAGSRSAAARHFRHQLGRDYCGIGRRSGPAVRKDLPGAGRRRRGRVLWDSHEPHVVEARSVGKRAVARSKRCRH